MLFNYIIAVYTENNTKPKDAELVIRKARVKTPERLCHHRNIALWMNGRIKWMSAAGSSIYVLIRKDERNKKLWKELIRLLSLRYLALLRKTG
jgi:hypothetical protein